MKNETNNHSRLRDGLIPGLVGLIGAVTLMLGPARPASAQAVAPSWSYTGNLNQALTPCPTGDMYGGSPGGALIIINQTDGSGRVVGTPNTAVGLTGIAFDATGRLFATTRGGTSTLIQLNPDTGALISTIGPIKVGDIPISIGDLGFQPGTRALFGIRSNADGAEAGGQLFKVDVITAAATLVGDTGAGASGGITFAPDGMLYQAAYNSSFDFPSLNTIDPSNAHRLRTVALTNFYDGLGIRPSDGILFATLGGSDTVFTINADTGGESFIGQTGLGVSDVDFRPICGANQIDDAQFFVRQHYRDFLNREPDADGLEFWAHQITDCVTDQGCIDAKRVNVSAAFYVSIEFQETGYLVYRIYKAAYGNLSGAPVPITFSEFLPDTQKIGQAVIVNQAGWDTVLENNKQAFMAEFVQRSRFTSAFPTSLTPGQFVDELFINAGVTPSATDRTAAVNEFGSASTTADTAARARALRRAVENSTLAQREFNKAFVLMQYFGYLRRNPNDAPELTLDFQGYNFWLTKLNQFNGSFQNAEMVKAFLVSTEYRQRFVQP